jgi:hypothetical protein
MAHLTHWERIAVVTDVDWIKNAMHLFAFMIPGAVRYFSLADTQQARDWIASSPSPLHSINLHTDGTTRLFFVGSCLSGSYTSIS